MAEKFIKRDIYSERGFTLLEVMIAMTIFVTFVTTFVLIQGNNLKDSSLLREEETLQRLCENKLSELTLHPPQFKEALTLTPTTKTFEENTEYEFTVVYKRFELPDFNRIQGKEDENTSPDDGQANSALEKKVYDQVMKIVKDALWQVEVTVTNKETKYNFTLSTWLRNHAAKVEISY